MKPVNRREGFDVVIDTPRTVDEMSSQEKRYLDVLEFLQATKTLYRILLNRPNVKQHTKAEIRTALYAMDDVGDMLSRNSSIKELDDGWRIVQKHFNNYANFSKRTRNRR